MSRLEAILARKRELQSQRAALQRRVREDGSAVRTEAAALMLAFGIARLLGSGKRGWLPVAASLLAVVVLPRLQARQQREPFSPCAGRR